MANWPLSVKENIHQLPIWQVIPEYPAEQLHSNPLPSVPEHVPLFKQGFGEQTSKYKTPQFLILDSQKAPNIYFASITMYMLHGGTHQHTSKDSKWTIMNHLPYLTICSRKSNRAGCSSYIQILLHLFLCRCHYSDKSLVNRHLDDKIPQFLILDSQKAGNIYFANITIYMLHGHTNEHTS